MNSSGDCSPHGTGRGGKGTAEDLSAKTVYRTSGTGFDDCRLLLRQKTASRAGFLRNMRTENGLSTKKGMLFGRWKAFQRQDNPFDRPADTERGNLSPEPLLRRSAENGIRFIWGRKLKYLSMANWSEGPIGKKSVPQCLRFRIFG